MTKQFGNTWWGQCWLNSLQGIDFDDRIPRGATYARSGAVKSMKFKGNVISAKVQGRRVTPYSITIVIPPFFEEDIGALMNEIIKRPALISELLNKKLNPELLTICNDLGLKLFPKRWNDFKMACSCPDWAVPCKHLAAVIYMMAQEIDTNPFLVFEMHNVNLISELEKRGVNINRDSDINVPTLKQLLKPAKKSTKDEVQKSKINFSQLNNIATSLFSFLENTPPFYGYEDFKNIYENELLKAQKALIRIFKRNLNSEEIFKDIEPINFSRRTKINLKLDTNYNWSIETNEGIISKEQLAAALYSLNPDYLGDFDDSVSASVQILYFAMHLLENGAVVPQILQTADKQFLIRWLPAMIDDKVKNIKQQLENQLDTNFVQIDKGKPTALNNGVEFLCSLFLNCFINLYTNNAENQISQFFFKTTREKFSSVGQKGISGSIKSWLDRFYMSAKEYRGVLIVDELNETDLSISLAVEKNGDKSYEAVPLEDVIIKEDFDANRFEILREISLLSHFIRGLDRYINSRCEQPIIYKINEFGIFLVEIIPTIKLLNVKVILPKSMQELIRPKISLTLERNNDDSPTFMHLEDMLSFDWRIALGDDIVSYEEYLALLNKTDRLIKFKGQYIYVSEADIGAINYHLKKNKSLSSFDLLQAALTEEYEGVPITLSSDVRSLIDIFRKNPAIQLPEGLNANLRPYQNSGYSWMYRNMKIGFGSIIADDMGLGKTLQVICVLLKLKEEKLLIPKTPAIIVVPKGLLINWQMEVAKFAPSLSTFIYHGTYRQISDFKEDILLTTYGTVRSDVDVLKKKKWSIMIIDEAQNIKNQATSQSKSVKEIKASTYIAMSGTPVENRLTEFWSIMDFVNKGYLGNIKSFQEKYAQPIQFYNDQDVIRRFKLATSPFILRRLKSDKSIISDLPDKIQQNEYCTLTKFQTALYDSTVQEAMAIIEGIEETDNKSLFKRRGLIFQMILSLKQICNHPSQFLKDSNNDPNLSGKTQMLLDLVQSIVDSDEKVLIFTQFREMGYILQELLENQLGDKPMFYHGNTSTEQRQEMIERFQKEKADKVFILSLKAAGTGLNLTAASHVIHYDLWWNPAVENQATDRAYRIGQNKNVFVHRFITKNTFEEKIDAMINSKKHLAEMTVATGENWLGKLSNKELHEIFG